MKNILILLFLTSLISACGGSGKGNSKEVWFKGNTHAHSNLSDGDSAPDKVARWYLDHDYNFLVLTDHNKFVDPKNIILPKDRRDNFILIGGEEVSGERSIHSTALNINKVVPWSSGKSEKKEIIQYQVDEITKKGGEAILNHPNFHWSVTAEDILGIKNLYMFELFNGHPAVHNYGDAQHPSTEEIWDELLTKGMKIYAISSDDTHHLKTLAFDKANPGRGWIMVKSSKLISSEITEAMLKGDFYATTGIILKNYNRSIDGYEIEIDDKKTKETLLKPYIHGNLVENCYTSYCNSDSSYTIQFITSEGKVVKTISGKKGTYKLKEKDLYIRVKIIYSQVNGGRYEEFYAWGQPIFKQN